MTNLPKLEQFVRQVKSCPLTRLYQIKETCQLAEQELCLIFEPRVVLHHRNRTLDILVHVTTRRKLTNALLQERQELCRKGLHLWLSRCCPLANAVYALVNHVLLPALQRRPSQPSFDFAASGCRLDALHHSRDCSDCGLSRVDCNRVDTGSHLCRTISHPVLPIACERGRSDILHCHTLPYTVIDGTD